MSISRSAIYLGEVMHHRLNPRRHRFVYRMRGFLFDIDELSSLSKQCRLLSLNRFNLFSFYFRDYGDGSGQPPRPHIESILRKHGIEIPLASTKMLCYPRIMGFTFNPLTVYYCYNRQQEVFAVLYEVSNTFGERHTYLIPVTPGSDKVLRHSCDKSFYVSPFMAMQQRYHFRLDLPGDHIRVVIRLSESGLPMLNTLFQGQRRPFCDTELLRCFLGMPLMTLKAVAAIHWEALKLWIKGLPLYPRSRPPANTVTVNQSSS